MTFSIAFLITALTVFPVSAFAGPGYFTYEGLLTDSSDQPIKNQTLSVKFEVIGTNDGADCVLAKDVRSISFTNGHFAVRVGGDLTKITVFSGRPFSDIFGTSDIQGDNNDDGTLDCTFAPSHTSNPVLRKLRVTVDNQPFDVVVFSAAPMAMIADNALQSQKIGATVESQLLRGASGVSTTALSQTQYDQFVQLLSGTSTQYLTPTSPITFGGDVTGTQSSTSVVKILGRALSTTAPTDKQVLKWNNTSSKWEPALISDSEVQNLSTNYAGKIHSHFASDVTSGTFDIARIPVGTTATTVAAGNDSRFSDTRTPSGSAGGDLAGTYPSPALAAVGTAGTYYKVTTDSKGRVTSGGTTVDVDAISSASLKYFTYKPNGAPCGTGDVMGWDGMNSRWVCVTQDALSVGSANQIRGTLVDPTSPTLQGQTLRYDGSKYTPSFLSLADIRSKINPANALFPASACTNRQTLMWSSISDTLSCANIDVVGSLGFSPVNKAGDVMTGPLALPVNGLTVGTNQIVTAGGNVGIGTAAPSGSFDVQGGTASSAVNGTNITLASQSAGTGNQNGGNIVLNPGIKTGTGMNGAVLVGASIAPLSMPANSLYVAGNLLVASTLQVSNSFSFGSNSVSIFGNGISSASDYLRINTNSIERMRLDGVGNVGIGTTTPRGRLDIYNGAIVGSPSVSNAVTTIDFSKGNIQSTPLSCTGSAGQFLFQNMLDGGTYIFIVKASSNTGPCQFTASGGFTFHYPAGHVANTSGLHTIYNFLVSGTDIYVTWMVPAN